MSVEKTPVPLRYASYLRDDALDAPSVCCFVLLTIRIKRTSRLIVHNLFRKHDQKGGANPVLTLDRNGSALQFHQPFSKRQA
jgi:hypothetical protein